ncbi:DMT family transporter [Novosphingobium sediminicola]|uniref:Drug/metabolite transporter (DMT)-like permease n=1 Tax=Novosphingobium sediminicola TaxID=563162 RepID=A0A7W6CQ34_9SPHN|nr:DMT family transporter [Novosphingobium sediminicola]MBB3957096.1 drug/metabolite transporter (DMT)-like permease [Novosphingobium sediminicola]
MLHIAAQDKPQRKPASWSISREEMVLIGITMLWGTTFLIVHTAMQYSGALFFVGLRFMVAGAGGWLLFARTMRDLNRRELGAGALIGFAIFLGYGLQTYGLRTITSSQSAFITALYVPMVPLLQLVVLRRMPHIMSWIGIALAFAGLILLAGPKAGHIGLSTGEMATLLSAVAIAAEIILISRFAHGVDSRRVTVVQLLAAGLFSLAAMPLAGEGVPAFSPVWLVAGVGLGLASTLIQLAMNWAQKTVSPTRATVIYAGEPVWGGIVGRIAGDRLPALAMLGGVLILVGVLVSELRGSAQDAP